MSKGAVDAIFSVNPHFAELIFDGGKTVELRTVAPRKPVERIWIYSTAPVMQIVGYFIPGAIQDATIEDCKKAHILDTSEYRRFFAIEILEPVRLEQPINPRTLDLGYRWLSPQSWRYCGEKEKAAFREHVNVEQN